MTIEFGFIGWCKEDNHDKVWTSFKVEDKWFCAWGRRGKKLQFKEHHTRWTSKPNSLATVENKKREKYKEVDAFLLFSLFPDFEDKVSQELLITMLQGKVK